mgnify:FL=1
MSLEEIVQQDEPDLRDLRDHREEVFKSLGLLLPRSLYEVSQWYDEHREELQEEFGQQDSDGDNADDVSNDETEEESDEGGNE